MGNPTNPNSKKSSSDLSASQNFEMPEQCKPCGGAGSKDGVICGSCDGHGVRERLLRHCHNLAPEENSIFADSFLVIIGGCLRFVMLRRGLGLSGCFIAKDRGMNDSRCCRRAFSLWVRLRLRYCTLSNSKVWSDSSPGLTHPLFQPVCMN